MMIFLVSVAKMMFHKEFTTKMIIIVHRIKGESDVYVNEKE